MKAEVVEKLLALNRDFYREMAGPFARSRARPQPGFYRLADYLPRPCPHLLDVGCGDGRLGRFLLARGLVRDYTGVDFSPEMLEVAQAITPGEFILCDLGLPGCLDCLPQFEAIACLATLQHIPGRDNRRQLLQAMATHLTATGRLILSNWQFLTNQRQTRKIVDWSRVGLTAAAVQPGDYLLTWQGDRGLRYVAYIDEAETAALAQAAGLAIIDHFYSDGKEGNLNLYTVLQRQ